MPRNSPAAPPRTPSWQGKKLLPSALALTPPNEAHAASMLSSSTPFPPHLLAMPTPQSIPRPQVFGSTNYMYSPGSAAIASSYPPAPSFYPQMGMPSIPVPMAAQPPVGNLDAQTQPIVRAQMVPKKKAASQPEGSDQSDLQAIFVERYKDYLTRRSRRMDKEGPWSLEVEQIFVEALRLVPPLHRKRVYIADKVKGRNELIAEYIYQRTGEMRSRKQVSSHIQVVCKAIGVDCDTLSTTVLCADQPFMPGHHEIRLNSFDEFVELVQQRLEKAPKPAILDVATNVAAQKYPPESPESSSVSSASLPEVKPEPYIAPEEYRFPPPKKGLDRPDKPQPLGSLVTPTAKRPPQSPFGSQTRRKHCRTSSASISLGNDHALPIQFNISRSMGNGRMHVYTRLLRPAFESPLNPKNFATLSPRFPELSREPQLFDTQIVHAAIQMHLSDPVVPQPAPLDTQEGHNLSADVQFLIATPQSLHLRLSPTTANSVVGYDRVPDHRWVVHSVITSGGVAVRDSRDYCEFQELRGQGKERVIVPWETGFWDHFVQHVREDPDPAVSLATLTVSQRLYWCPVTGPPQLQLIVLCEFQLTEDEFARTIFRRVKHEGQSSSNSSLPQSPIGRVPSPIDLGSPRRSSMAAAELNPAPHSAIIPPPDFALLGEQIQRTMTAFEPLDNDIHDWVFE